MKPFKAAIRWVSALMLALMLPACAEPPVTITPDHKVAAPTYEASVANDGSLSSIKINGQEFLRLRGPSRGAYFYQNGNIDMAEITTEEPTALVAKGEKASVRYEFKPDAMKWSLTNLSDKYMNFFMVLDPAVGIGRSDAGEWAKSPVGKDWKTSTWFGEKSRLQISGATRVWGPWNDLNQVVEATLEPKSTRVVEFKIGTPDTAETARIKELSQAAAATAAAVPAAAEPEKTGLRVPSFFGDNMVLQREMQNPIWGWANPGEAITVSAPKQSKKTTADDKGKWLVRLDSLPAGGPYQITVTGKTVLTFKNVLSGDVWLCSGQSNMALTLHDAADGGPEIESANDPQLRVFRADLKSSDMPRTDVTGNWNAATAPAAVKDFSAVGYFFGKRLRQELKVPIGLISTAWGGTQIEAWLSPGSLKADLDYGAIAARAAKDAAAGPNRQRNNDPSGLYNGMNMPMATLAIRGVAWYQGEANFGRGFQYRRLFPLMINDWRKLWARPDLPFVWVQIPNIGSTPAQPTGSGWAETREAQAMTLAVPHTAMAVAIDLGDPKDIHPKFKKEVGNRLALTTLQKIYKRDIAGSSPLYAAMKIEGGAIRVSFKDVGGGLVAKDGAPLQGFAIAGADKKWFWADAKIDGADVLVSSSQVPAPVAARYAWADTPVVSLYNKAGLPASPFRTDDWPEWTTNNK